jgi:hypothetical protein
VGHFARECPEYTGAPYPQRGRGAMVPFGRGGAGRGGGEYGTSKCLKCNRCGREFATEL